MATSEMQRYMSEKERLTADYMEWQLQADIYFDAQDFIGAYGAANMAATKLKQLSELENPAK